MSRLNAFVSFFIYAGSCALIYSSGVMSGSILMFNAVTECLGISVKFVNSEYAIIVSRLIGTLGCIILYFKVRSNKGK